MVFTTKDTKTTKKTFSKRAGNHESHELTRMFLKKSRSSLFRFHSCRFVQFVVFEFSKRVFFVVFVSFVVK